MPQPLSATDICNLALQTCSLKPIATLGDPIETARSCNRWYDFMRRELLEESDWGWARKSFALNLIGSSQGLANFPDWAQSGLAAAAGGPGLTPGNWQFPWAYIYQYPAQCLYVHKVYSPTAPAAYEEWVGYDQSVRFSTWLERNRAGWELIRSAVTNEYAIATNLAAAQAKYTSDITDTTQFDNTFVDALQLKIAQKLVTPLTGDMELKAQIDKDLVDAMTKAYRQNFSQAPEYGPRSSAYEDVRGM